MVTMGAHGFHVTNEKSSVADQSVSVPVTSIDLEKRDAIGHTFMQTP